MVSPMGGMRERHLFLLTDGAVSNTQSVVNLIHDNSKYTKVHTFGLGSGVSTELVKNSAMAGRGHFYFIDKMSEIDSKVLDALQREAYEYRVVTGLKFIDKHGNEAQVVKDKKQVSLAHGTQYSMITLVDPAREHVRSVEVMIEDPNDGSHKQY